jgi:hypothetical protein
MDRKTTFVDRLRNKVKFVIGTRQMYADDIKPEKRTGISLTSLIKQVNVNNPFCTKKSRILLNRKTRCIFWNTVTMNGFVFILHKIAQLMTKRKRMRNESNDENNSDECSKEISSAIMKRCVHGHASLDYWYEYRQGENDRHHAKEMAALHI